MRAGPFPFGQVFVLADAVTRSALLILKPRHLAWEAGSLCFQQANHFAALLILEFGSERREWAKLGSLGKAAGQFVD